MVQVGTKLGSNFDPTANFDGGFREELLFLIMSWGGRMQGGIKGRRERDRRNCRPNTIPLQERNSWDLVANLKSHQRSSELASAPGSPRHPGYLCRATNHPLSQIPLCRTGHQRHIEGCPDCPACRLT